MLFYALPGLLSASQCLCYTSPSRCCSGPVCGVPCSTAAPRSLAVPSLIPAQFCRCYSSPVFALPTLNLAGLRLCFARLLSASPTPRMYMQCPRSAGLAMPLRSLSMLRHCPTVLCRRLSAARDTMPVLRHTLHSRGKSSLLLALPQRIPAMQIYAVALIGLSMPCRCRFTPCPASPEPLVSWQCRCSSIQINAPPSLADAFLCYALRIVALPPRGSSGLVASQLRLSVSPRCHAFAVRYRVRCTVLVLRPFPSCARAPTCRRWPRS